MLDFMWAQDGRERAAQLRQPKWLMQHREATVPIHHRNSMVTGNKSKRYAAFNQCIRHGIALLSIEIKIEQRRVDLRSVFDHCQRLLHAGRTPKNRAAE